MDFGFRFDFTGNLVKLANKEILWSTTCLFIYIMDDFIVDKQTKYCFGPLYLNQLSRTKCPFYTFTFISEQLFHELLAVTNRVDLP